MASGRRFISVGTLTVTLLFYRRGRLIFGRRLPFPHGVSPMAARQIKLNAFMRPASIHTGAWRYPGAWPDMNFNFAHIKEAIQKLEAAKFDAFFMADHMAVLNMPMD